MNTNYIYSGANEGMTPKGYTTNFGMIESGKEKQMWYGISWKSELNYRLFKFDTYEEALEWLNDEEYDFRVRQISDNVNEINTVYSIETDDDDYIDINVYRSLQMN